MLRLLHVQRNSVSEGYQEGKKWFDWVSGFWIQNVMLKWHAFMALALWK